MQLILHISIWNIVDFAATTVVHKKIALKKKKKCYNRYDYHKTILEVLYEKCCIKNLKAKKAKLKIKWESKRGKKGNFKAFFPLLCCGAP